MNMVKTRSADKDFYLLESFITIFAFEESLERFALQFGVPDTRPRIVEQRFFEKRVADDKWRSHTLSKRNENWNAKQKCISTKDKSLFS